MGNQQLLLVILVTVLVGVATIVAINVFGDVNTEANREAVRQDLLNGVSYAQSFYFNHPIIGGAGRDFSSIENDIIMLVRLPGKLNGNDEWENENGKFTIEDVGTHSFVIRARPATGPPDIVANIQRDIDNSSWIVSISDDVDS